MPNFYILDVGHGNCSVLDDNGQITVIDTGSGFHLLKFLLYHEMYEIGILILSHADSDHISGVMKLLGSNEISIKNFYVNPDSSKKSDIWDDLLYSMYEYSKSLLSHKKVSIDK